MPVVDIKAKDVIQNNMMNYGAYVILQRAIPDLRDGLKPVHRRILYTLHVNGAVKFKKSQRVEGNVMAYHPHGGTYDTMVKMVQKDRHSIPYVIGEGSFGQYTSKNLAPAAPRYTEVKLAPITIDVMSDLKKNVINMIPNFDGEEMEPEVLPVKAPWILMQAASGVAYGMASSTPSFNSIEMINATIKFIKEGKKTLLIPDFATKGYIVNDPETFKKINLTGRGSVMIRGKAEIEGNNIYITEIPYGTKRENIIQKIVELGKDKLKDVSSVKDLTGLKGLKILVKFKRGTDMNLALEKLYQFTPLQSPYSANMNVLHNGSPKVMSVWQIIDEWIKWRISVIVRGLNHDIAKMSKRLHFLRGLEKVLLDIDKAIEIIRRSEEDQIEPNLMKTFKIDEAQAKSIADMKLRNINKTYIISQTKSIEKLEYDLNKLKSDVSDKDALNEYVIKGLEETRDKYGVQRQSKIIEVNNEKIKAVKKKLQEVPNYPVRLFITKEGYVKKNKNMEAHKDEQYLKPGDEIVNVFDTYNGAELLVFGSDCCCYKIKINEIDETPNKALGAFIPSLCDTQSDIVGASVLDSIHKFIIISYGNNKIAKIKLDSFSGNRKKLANSLAKNANVVGILTFKEESKFIIKSANAEIELLTSGFELKERWTQGVFAARKGTPISIRKA